MERPRHRYLLLIYQVPSQPSAARVAIWRELKRLGALYLQQSVCIMPSTAAYRAQLEAIAARITVEGGMYHLLPLRQLPPEEDAKIVEGFLAQSTQQYEEIIENCEVNFTKEIDFETFRQNFTYAEAEEIRQDLDKMRRWYERVVQRDWYGSPRREDAAAWIARCEGLLEAFEEQVFARQQADLANAPALSEQAQDGARPLRLRRGQRTRGPRSRDR